MGKSQHQQASAFSLEGRFLGFGVEDGYKLKYLHLATAEGEYAIKLSKEARASVGRVLMPGDWLQVIGRKKVDRETGVAKLKADRIQTAVPRRTETVAAPSPQSQPAAAKVQPVEAKASILVCQKSDCMKRGGRAVCQALQAELSDRGLEDQVKIKMTGCMKHCKAGPNLVVMPDKTRYSRITAAEVPEMLDKHFPNPVEVEEIQPEPLVLPVPVASRV